MDSNTDSVVSIGGGDASQPGSDTVVPGALQFVAIGGLDMQFLGAGDTAAGSGQPEPPTAGGGLSIDFVELNAASPGMHATGGASGANSFVFDIRPEGGSATGASVAGAAGGSPLLLLALDQASAGMLNEFGASHRGIGGGAMHPDGQAPRGSLSHGDAVFQPVIIPFATDH